MGIIYKVTFPNQKYYIGQTMRTLEKRKKEHEWTYLKRNTAFYNAIRKYGWDSLMWETIDEADTREELNQKEIYWIKYYNSCVLSKNSNGYNSTYGGDLCTPPKLFTTKEEILQVLQEFKDCGSITQIANNHNCGYGIIYQIVCGIIRQDLSGLYDDSFYKKYANMGLFYSNEQINTIIELDKEGKNSREIMEATGISMKYIRDILSGRVGAKKTNIKHITREERSTYNPVNSKFTKDEVLDIIKMYNQGVSVKEIADKYNKNKARIYEIVNGITWTGVTGLKHTKKLKELPNGEKVRKFCKNDILEIVELYNQGKSKKEIAELKDTSVGYINSILSGNKWNNVTHIKK